ncbi:MAG: L-asparaginase II [Rhodospirillaceae bacterium]|nr:MAG: L-asparaginase II [Rhodospirillaceae bacterium]
MPKANPVLVEVTRANLVESRHRGACVIVQSSGEIVKSWGDVEALVYPRSALKPLQALPFIETGAADHYDVSLQEIALACASHNSEPFHTTRISAWLDRLGLGPDDLECGPGEPLSLNVSKALYKSGEKLTRVHNNCSGKHTGFLATALHMGVPTKGYIKPDHPVQQQINQVLEDMTGASLSTLPCGTDGCGIPVYGLPLTALAKGLAKMMADDLPAPRAQATKRVMAAMAACPHCIAGDERFDTRVMTQTKGAVLVKGGAEGVHIAMIPERKLAIALKIDDGTIRASELAMGCILNELGVFDADAQNVLADLIEMPIYTTLGERAGEIRRGPDFVF